MARHRKSTDRRLQYLVCASLLTSLLHMSAPSRAHACTCGGPESLEAAVAASDAVFAGTVVDDYYAFSSLEGQPAVAGYVGMYSSIEVERVWKGSVPFTAGYAPGFFEPATGEVYGSTCDFTLRRGGYLFFAHQRGDGYFTAVKCSGTSAWPLGQPPALYDELVEQLGPVRRLAGDTDSRSSTPVWDHSRASMVGPPWATVAPASAARQVRPCRCLRDGLTDGAHHAERRVRSREGTERLITGCRGMDFRGGARRSHCLLRACLATQPRNALRNTSPYPLLRARTARHNGTAPTASRPAGDSRSGGAAESGSSRTASIRRLASSTARR